MALTQHDKWDKVTAAKYVSIFMCIYIKYIVLKYKIQLENMIVGNPFQFNKQDILTVEKFIYIKGRSDCRKNLKNNKNTRSFNIQS